MAIVTITGSDVSGGSPSGGGVGGASNLTTAGAVPYVASAGVLSQDQTSGGEFFWDSTNHRLALGNASPESRLHIRQSSDTYAGALKIQNSAGAATPRTFSWVTGGDGNLYFGSASTASGAPTDRLVLRGDTGNLLLGTTTDDGSWKLQVVGQYGASFYETAGSNNSRTVIDTIGGSRVYQYNSSGVLTNLINSGGSASYFIGNNILIGGTTDGNYRLDVQKSGSSGTLRVYDQTVTTGSTSLVVRAGAGQSGNLTTWQDSAGATYGGISSTGATIFAANQWHTSSGGDHRLYFTNGSATYVKSPTSISFRNVSDVGMMTLVSISTIKVPSGSVLGWSNAADSEGGTIDVGAVRSSAGVLEINNGTAGTLRDLTLRNLFPAGLYVTGAFGSLASGYFQFQSDGVLRLTNNAASDFNRLQFGGTTSSFPALKRSSAILQVRLADDSANTQVQASRFISDQTTPSASTDAGTAGAIWADATYLYVQTAAGTIKRVTLNAF